MVIDNSMDSLAVVEKLVDDTIKENPVVEEKSETTPEPLVKEEAPVAEENKPEATPEANKEPVKPVVNYRQLALEQMRKDLADKKDLTDEDVETAMYQRVINAAKRVQREVEQRKTLEGKLEELNKFKSYVEKLYEVPQFVKLTQGKAKIVDLEEGNPDEQVDQDPIALLGKRLEEKIAQVEARLANRDQKETIKTQQEQQAEAEKKVVEELTREERVLCSKYPPFKEWVDYRKRSGICPPELEEIVSLAEEKGYSLTDAAKIYFTDKGVSALLESNKQETLRNLKGKAAQKTEGGRAEAPTEETMNFSDTRDLATRLVENALK